MSWFPGGTTVRVGTCSASGDLPTASHVGDTFLRLVNTETGAEVAKNDDKNVGTCSGNGSYVVYTLPFNMTIGVRAGGFGSLSCSGTIGVNADMDSNGSLSNVVAAFTNLWNSTRTLKPWRYTDPGVNNIPRTYKTPPLSLWDGTDHFQGVQRLRSWGPTYYHASWFVISGSDNADLFFVYLYPNIEPSFGISLAQGPADPTHSSMRIRKQSTAVIDGGIAVHYGGMQAFGHYLAVGLENGQKSHIQFFDVNDPTNARLMYSFIGRENGVRGPTGGAAATAIAKAPGLEQPYWMAVPGQDSKMIDFYKANPNIYGYAKVEIPAWSHSCTSVTAIDHRGNELLVVKPLP